MGHIMPTVSVKIRKRRVKKHKREKNQIKTLQRLAVSYFNIPFKNILTEKVRMRTDRQSYQQNK